MKIRTFEGKLMSYDVAKSCELFVLFPCFIIMFLTCLIVFAEKSYERTHLHKSLKTTLIFYNNNFIRTRGLFLLKV